MIKLAFLLIGGRAFREDWWEPAVAGLLTIALGFAVIADVSDGLTTLATQLFGLLFLIQGLMALFGMAFRTTNAGRNAEGVKAGVMLVLGAMILDPSMRSEPILNWLFAAGLVIDGLSRLATVALVRFRRWGHALIACSFEVLLAVLIVSEWPLPSRLNIPLCVSLLLVMSGITMVRLAFTLRRHNVEEPLYAHPMFCVRGWNDNVRHLPDDPVRTSRYRTMRVLVWTPAGAVEMQPRRPIIDRYLAALDKHGELSIGHAAIEMGPDFYLSHWPANEIDPGECQVTEVLYAGADNDVPGLFQPSYEHECNIWTPADEEIVFNRLDPAHLEGFIRGYCEHSTYNVTNRNCSIAVAGALEAGLEASLECRSPWLRLCRLMLTPSLWEAAYIRSRAAHLCWTPGLVLDYARALQRLVEPTHVPWPVRLFQGLRLRAVSMFGREIAR